jgi:hypothetical protein
VQRPLGKEARLRARRQRGRWGDALCDGRTHGNAHGPRRGLTAPGGAPGRAAAVMSERVSPDARRQWSATDAIACITGSSQPVMSWDPNWSYAHQSTERVYAKGSRVTPRTRMALRRPHQHSLCHGRDARVWRQARPPCAWPAARSLQRGRSRVCRPAGPVAGVRPGRVWGGGGALTPYRRRSARQAGTGAFAFRRQGCQTLLAGPDGLRERILVEYQTPVSTGSELQPRDNLPYTITKKHGMPALCAHSRTAFGTWQPA